MDKKNYKLLLYLSFELGQQLLFAVHGDLQTGHVVVQKCKERLMECYLWQKMDKDNLIHTKKYLKFQATKSSKFLKMAPLQPIPQCSPPNQCIHMGLFGPCKLSDMGDKYLLAITDAVTKYAEFVAISNKEVKTVEKQSGFAHPDEAIIHTDGGKEFLNKMASEL